MPEFKAESTAEFMPETSGLEGQLDGSHGTNTLDVRDDLRLLLARDFNTLNPDWRDVLGECYRASTTGHHAKSHGQYFTPEMLCDVMIAWALRGPGDRVLDPGCGTGRFLLRAGAALQARFNQTPGACLEQLYGVELDAEAASLCRAQLTARQGEGCAFPPPRIYTGDFLGNLPEGFDAFDAIIGNPPYIRHELLKDHKAAWLADLADLYGAQTWASFFGTQKARLQTLDLYLLFVLKATCLLRPGGRLAFVMSNSWLETDQAASVLRFLNAHYHLHAIVESGVETWFADAAINPVILLAEKKDPADTTPGDSDVRLIQLQSDLASLTPADIPRVLSAPHPKTEWRRVSQARFCSPEPLSAMFYLKADTPMRQLRHDSRLWQPLQSFGTVRYPLKTGINGFFYLSAETAERFGIEPEFLRPVLKSTRQVRQIALSPQDSETLLFCCPLSPTELQARGHAGALRYIAWGSMQQAPVRQKRAEPVAWPHVASVQGRPHWYQVKTLAPADFLCSRFYDRRFFMAENSAGQPLMEDQTFYGVQLKVDCREADERMFLAALLNSTVSYLWLELNGRTNLGEGVLQYSRAQMAAHALPNPALYEAQAHAEILAIYSTLRQRPILQVFEEVQAEDRQALDRLILAPLGVDPEAVTEALCRQVAARLNRAERRRR